MQNAILQPSGRPCFSNQSTGSCYDDKAWTSTGSSGPHGDDVEPSLQIVHYVFAMSSMTASRTDLCSVSNDRVPAYAHAVEPHLVDNNLSH